MVRIEVTEKYPVQPKSNSKYDRQWWLENVGKLPPDEAESQSYDYRRTYLILDTIERPIEIPGKKGECILRLYSGEDIIIKENYDEFCIRLDDLEMLLEEIEDEYIKESIAKNGGE